MRRRTSRTSYIRMAIRGIATGAIAVTVALGAAGCTPGSSTEKAGATLNIAAASGPTTLNPVANGTGIPNEFFLDQAYDPLIIREGDGSLRPGLATEWGYTDDTNKTFEITLREGVQFSDGADLNAEGVKKWLEYFRDGTGVFAAQFAGLKDVEIINDKKIRLHLSESSSLWPNNLTQNRYGYVISPAALDNPDALGTMTAGAGGYVINPSETVTGQKYVYDKNTKYWNPGGQHWDRIVVTVITDANSALSSIQSGQVDFLVGQARSAQSAEDAGINVKRVPYLWNAVVLMDRAGTQVPALGDVRVRQALNYAVDREAVSRAVFGKFGTANSSMIIEGFDGFDKTAQDPYPYDPEKAKKLLTEAGYGNGFDMPMLVFNRNGTDETTFAQAVQGELAKIGVRVQLIDAGDGSTVIPDVLALKYPTWAFFGQVEDPTLLVAEQLAPDAGVLNPFATEDTRLLELWQQALAAQGGDQVAGQQALQRYIAEQAFYLQVSVSDIVYFHTDKVDGLDVSNAQPIAYLPDLKPAA